MYIYIYGVGCSNARTCTGPAEFCKVLFRMCDHEWVDSTVT